MFELLEILPNKIMDRFKTMSLFIIIETNTIFIKLILFNAFLMHFELP